MRRREFVTGIGAVVARPVTTRAQSPSKIPRVGIITTSTPEAGMHIVEAFRRELESLGYVDGRTVAIEVRWSHGGPEQIPRSIAELIDLKVDVLVASNSLTALVARTATRSIPIVMFAGDPVQLGLVDSLARPGGNVTGLSFFSVDINSRRLQFIVELIPDLARVAVLMNPGMLMHAAFIQETEAAARKLGVTLLPLEVRAPGDFEPAFTAAARANVQALLALDDPLTIAHRSQIVGLAASTHIPAMYGFREFPDSGGLMSYGPNLVTLFRRAAGFVDKILKGAKPADLPVEQPTQFELVINLRTAKALGLAVPPIIFAQATEVIE